MSLLPGSAVARYLFTFILGSAVTLLLEEITRARRRQRIIVKSGQLPTLVLVVSENHALMRISGRYSLTNLSEVKVCVSMPHIEGYNAANRAFRFHIASRQPRLGGFFEEIQIPSDSDSNEVVLVDDKDYIASVDRFELRSVPGFLWLETLQTLRLGGRRRYRWRARLYRLWPPRVKAGEFWYTPTRIEVKAKTARMIALPGKWLHRRRCAHAPVASTNGGV